jgi:hypothetical protein
MVHTSTNPANKVMKNSMVTRTVFRIGFVFAFQLLATILKAHPQVDVAKQIAYPDVLKELRNGEFPEKGDKFGRSFKISQVKDCKVAEVQMDDKVRISMGLTKGVNIDSLLWTKGGIWGVVRKNIGFGDEAKAIIYWNLEQNDPKLIVFKIFVQYNNQVGHVFRITNADDDNINIVFSIKNTKSNKLDFFEGSITKTKMEPMKKEDVERLLDPPSFVEDG